MFSLLKPGLDQTIENKQEEQRHSMTKQLPEILVSFVVGIGWELKSSRHTTLWQRCSNVRYRRCDDVELLVDMISTSDINVVATSCVNVVLTLDINVFLTSGINVVMTSNY